MRVGFIGLGTMGSRMATNLLAVGHLLVVNDLDPEAGLPLLDLGATWAVSPAAVADQVEVLFTSLPGPSQVEAVALGPEGIIGGARPGLAWFDLSTNSPTVMRRLHAELTPRGLHVFDAPVSGGPDGAASGRLAIWVGGDPDVYETFLPLLLDFSDAPHLVGPIGAGSVAKLVHNASGYIIQTALAETFTLGVKAGVEPEALWEAVRTGALGRRRTFDSLSRNFLPGRFDPPDFALELARKDVSLACELGREYDVPLRLTNLTLMEMTEAMNRGWARRDSRSAMLLQEERSGVEVRIPSERIATILGEEAAQPAPQALERHAAKPPSLLDPDPTIDDDPESASVPPVESGKPPSLLDMVFPEPEPEPGRETVHAVYPAAAEPPAAEPPAAEPAKPPSLLDGPSPAASASMAVTTLPLALRAAPADLPVADLAPNGWVPDSPDEPAAANGWSVPAAPATDLALAPPESHLNGGPPLPGGPSGSEPDPADSDSDSDSAAPAPPPKGWFYGWTVVASVFFILMITSGLGFYNVGVILRAAVRELDAPVGAVSVGPALFFSISGITGFVLARRMEKVDLRWFYVAGGFLGAAALYSLRWVETVFQLYVFFSVFGAGFAMAGLVPGITLVTRWFNARRSIAISIASTGLSLGGIALTPISTWLIEGRGLGGAGPILSVIWLLGVIPVGLLFIRSRPAQKGMGPDGVPLAVATASQPAAPAILAGASFVNARRSRFFIMMCVAYALIFFSQVGGLAHLFNLASERVDSATGNLALALLALTSVAGRLLGGVIVLKIPTKTFSMALMVLQAVALMAVAFSFGRLSILGSAVFLGISVGNLLMLQPLLLAEAFGVAEFSRIYSFNQLFSTIGVAGGPVILGLVHDVSNYQVSFVLGGAGSFLGFLAFLVAGPIDRPLNLWGQHPTPSTGSGPVDGVVTASSDK